MNSIITPVAPLATAIADVFVALQSATRRFMNSKCTPTWTEFMKDCHKG
ncbi:hypothetical protein SAMN04488030_3339 [Aliiroseovarius halocynthiae]|nr:hypothetical protein [Aliiroseovarius halocynthiae]SMR83420.1 hypothetical protein SAMN04488030_3339 [Aliiroseovarius halocynthiae]